MGLFGTSNKAMQKQMKNEIVYFRVKNRAVGESETQSGPNIFRTNSAPVGMSSVFFAPCSYALVLLLGVPMSDPVTPGKC